MRHITQQGLILIKQFESLYLKPYNCPAGYPTIGYGHVIQAHEMTIFHNGITESIALTLLQKDIQLAERAVLRLISSPLNAPQFDALVSLTFNIGAAALQRSTLRRKINAAYYHEAPSEFKRWVYSGGKKLRGLVRRRNAEAQLFMS